MDNNDKKIRNVSVEYIKNYWNGLDYIGIDGIN